MKCLQTNISSLERIFTSWLESMTKGRWQKQNSANWSGGIQKHSDSVSHSLILSQGWHFDLCTSVDKIKQLYSFFLSLCHAITFLSHPLLKHLTVQTETETAMIDWETQSVLHKPKLSGLLLVSSRGHAVKWPVESFHQLMRLKQLSLWSHLITAQLHYYPPLHTSHAASAISFESCFWLLVPEGSLDEDKLDKLSRLADERQQHAAALHTLVTLLT